MKRFSQDTVNKRLATKLQNAKKHIGERFGRIEIIDIISKQYSSHNRNLCVCKCDCGNITHVPYYDLKNGKTKSCGCIQREMMSNNASKYLKNKNKHNWYFIKDNVKYYCASGYEVLYANYLVDNNIDFKYQPFVFKSSNNRSYTPDFYICDTDTYVEIKGIFFERDEQLSKIEEFKLLYNFEILYWDDISKLCNINKTYSGLLKPARVNNILIEDFLGNRLYI